MVLVPMSKIVHLMVTCGFIYLFMCEHIFTRSRKCARMCILLYRRLTPSTIWYFLFLLILQLWNFFFPIQRYCNLPIKKKVNFSHTHHIHAMLLKQNRAIFLNQKASSRFLTIFNITPIFICNNTVVIQFHNKQDNFSMYGHWKWWRQRFIEFFTRYTVKSRDCSSKHIAESM